MDREIIDYQQLQSLKDDLEDDFREIYDTIFFSIDDILGQIRQKTADTQTLIRLFHSLKSPARSLGANRFAQRAEYYEKQTREQTLQSLDRALDDLEGLFNQVREELKDYDAG
jgi:HPt (histidine-containing phosphotransfer) domain-containing protein